MVYDYFSPLTVVSKTFLWTLHQKGSPKTDDHVAVAVKHKLYYFGRNRHGNNKDQIDVQVFNTVSLCWMKLPPVTPGRGERPPEVPSIRGDTAVLIGDIVYIWGGFKYGKSEYCNLLHAFDVDTHKWFKPQVSGTVPKGRYGHSACVLGKFMYVYGGFKPLTRQTNDVYKLDTSTMVWSLINTRGTQPTASHWHSATIIGTKMFVFGGTLPHSGLTLRWGGDNYNTISVFDTVTNSWLNTPPAELLPERRWGHSAFAYNGELYIFGGKSTDLHLNCLWKFSPESFSWKEVKPKGKGPSPMLRSRMCCCMVGDRVFLFGGINTADDLYVLDLSPSLKTLCKLEAIRYGLEKSELPHNIRWELAAMTTNN